MPKLNKAERETLRMMFGGNCAYCGCLLPEKGWHADHIEPVMREWWKKFPRTRYEIVDGEMTTFEEKQTIGLTYPGRDVQQNLFPSCRACNIDKHAMSVEDWRRTIERKVKVLRDNYSAFRHAERFGLVIAAEKPAKRQSVIQQQRRRRRK